VVHDDVAQAQNYRDELRAYIGNQDERIELAILGGKVDRVLPGASPRTSGPTASTAS